LAREDGGRGLKTSHRNAGTPWFKSPEQWLERTQRELESKEFKLTKAIDVYAFAVLAVQVLTGHILWSGKNSPEFKEAFSEREVPVLAKEKKARSIGRNFPQLAAFLQRCLSFEPKQRPDMIAVVNALHAEHALSSKA
jgi:serine/threonine protein kinase